MQTNEDINSNKNKSNFKPIYISVMYVFVLNSLQDYSQRLQRLLFRLLLSLFAGILGFLQLNLTLRNHLIDHLDICILSKNQTQSLDRYFLETFMLSFELYPSP